MPNNPITARLGLLLLIALGLALEAKAAEIIFDSSQLEVTVDGTSVSAIGGAPLVSVETQERLVQFTFAGNVNFAPGDLVLMRGSLPIRVVATGNIVVPVGTDVSADGVVGVENAGGGQGGAGTPGGSGGLVVPLAVALGEVEPHEVLPTTGIPVNPSEGGAGGTETVDAKAGEVGGGATVTVEGELSRGHIGLPGGGGSGGSRGELGAFAKASRNQQIWPNNGNTSITPGPTTGGAAGTAGATGGFLGNGVDGGDGGDGEAGTDGANGTFGVPGKGGSSAARSDYLLYGGVGGNGGQGGSGGSGGSSGACGGAGGGGGAGGSAIGGRGKGGKGGAGGIGRYGGNGGAGGRGSDGEPGGGAFELRSLAGVITIRGRLLARGVDPEPGMPGEPGQEGVGDFNPTFVPLEGGSGATGEVVAGTNGGNGGDGGKGGAGGKGGDGGPGGGGGGGQGGTIILRAPSILVTGTIDVRGGTAGPSALSQLGLTGDIWVEPTPSFFLEPDFVEEHIEEGAGNGAPPPADSFLVQNTGSAEFRYRVSSDAWWLPASQHEGAIIAGGQQAIDYTKYISELGGGVHTATITITPKDPESFAAPQVFTYTVEVEGFPDDHPEIPIGSTEIAATPSSQVSGILEQPGDSDLFRVEVPADGFLEVYTSGNTDTFGTLLDGNSVEIVSDDDDGDSTNFRIERAVGPGTYYISVRGYSTEITGAYQLHLRFYGPDYLPDLTLATGPSDGVLSWISPPTTTQRLSRSTDLLRWTPFGARSYSGAGEQVSVPIDTTADRQFFRFIPPGKEYIRVGGVTTSTNNAGSASVFAALPGLDLEVGHPPAFGDTVITSFGEPLSQDESVTIASVRKESFVSIVEVAGGIPGDAPTRLITRTSTANNGIGGTRAYFASFPLGGGWSTGRYDGQQSTGDLTNLPDHLFFTPLLNVFGLSVPVRPGEEFVPGVSRFTRGVFLATGTGSAPRSNIVTARPLLTLDDEPPPPLTPELGVEFINSDPDGTPTEDPFAFVYLPYSTPGIVAGRVLADGQTLAGTGDFSIEWVASREAYHLTLPGGASQLDGALFLTCFDADTRCNMNWSVPAEGGFDIHASAFPLSTVTPSQCEFFFAYIPFDNAVFAE